MTYTFQSFTMKRDADNNGELYGQVVFLNNETNKTEIMDIERASFDEFWENFDSGAWFTAYFKRRNKPELVLDDESVEVKKFVNDKNKQLGKKNKEVWSEEENP